MLDAMRAVLALALVLVAAGAPAAHAQWSEPDPPALVGHWTGAATWRNCAVTGHARVALDVARDGSGYRIDLAPLLDGLGVETFAPVGGPIVEAARADLQASWTMHVKPDRATLLLALGPVCRASVALRRASLGVAACDDLVGLRAVAAACPLLDPAPARTADDALARLRPGRRLASRPRAAAAAACRREATPLRAALIETGCVPIPVERAAAVPIPECDALIRTVVRATRCDRIPVEIKTRLTDQIRIVARSAAVSDTADRAGLVESCALTHREVADTLTLVGCR